MLQSGAALDRIDLSMTLGARPKPTSHSANRIAASTQSIEFFKDWIRDAAGIELGPDKDEFIRSRLQKRLRDLGLGSLQDYVRYLDTGAGASERDRLVSLLTTNLTRFFREPHHFEHLAETSLPPMIKAAKAGQPIRIWSAGCSSGEEAYSIAITLLGLSSEASRLDIKILASDIDRKILSKASRAQYPMTAIEKLPQSIRKKYFDQAGGLCRPKDFVRNMVTFNHLNIVQRKWPMKSNFDIIFCRNTVIYFSEETRRELWPKFADRIRPGGWLYIGHSERIQGDAKSEFERTATTTYHRL